MAAIVCGIDEVGRGCLAGPVLACAAILPPMFPMDELNDSKKLSPKKREALANQIRRECVFGVGAISHKTIDSINILQATMRAMQKAFCELLLKLPLFEFSEWFSQDGNIDIEVIVDGNRVPDLSFDALESLGFAGLSSCKKIIERAKVSALVKADAKVPAVMAASIVAKVKRDAIMCQYDKLFPQYGYAKHKGYPTPAHKKACLDYGVSPIQRLSFRI